MKFVLLTLLLPFNIYAASEGVPLELPAMPAPLNDKDSSGPKFETACTTAEGRKLKHSDAGYESCLVQSQSDMNQRFRDGKTNSPEGNSTSMEVNFGQ